MNQFIREIDYEDSESLCDGYYHRALEQLQPPPYGLKEAERLEASYRLGRIHFALGHYPQALESFEKAMQFKRRSTHHQVGFAHLWCAQTYEVLGRIQKARELYRFCLKISTDSYEDSLRQKARAGLKRLEGR